MQLLLRNIGTFLLSIVSSERFKERVTQNLQALIKDDQVVEEVFFGLDEYQPVVIAATNKELLVIGDHVIHCISKQDIIEFHQTKGIFVKLIEVQAVKEQAYFKVFSNKPFKKLRDWIA